MTEKPAGLITIVTSIIISASVGYDWGYFLVIESRYFRLLSLGDHISSTLEKIPYFVIGATIGLLWTIYDFKKYSNGKDKTIDYDKKNFAPMMIIRDSVIVVEKPNIILTVVMALASIIYYLFSGNYMFFVAILSILVWRRIWHHLTFILWEWEFQSLSTILFWIPTLLLLSVLIGAGAGQIDFHKKKGNTEITLNNGKKLHGLVLLRSTQYGLMVRSPHTGENSIISWSSIREQKIISKVRKRSRVCRWFGLCIGSADRKVKAKK